MIKKWTAIAMAAVMSLTCTACNSSKETADTTQDFTPRLDTEEEVTINIVGNMSNFEALEAVITDFETYYPDCEVLYSPISDSGEYWSALELRLKSDDSVGIFMMSDSQYSDSLKDACYNLLEEDIDLSAIQEEVISSSTVENVLYSIPVMHNASGLIVNKTLLEENNLEIPTNYSEFLEACEALKGSGYTPIQGYAPSINDVLMRSMSFVLMNNAFEDASDTSLDSLKAGEEGSADILEPVFDVLNTLYEKGYLDKEVNLTYTDGYNDAILRFFEGDVPFLVGTTETFSGMKKRESKSEHFSSDSFEYAYMATPFAEEGAYSYIGNWYGFSVNKNCSNRDWAVEFLRFVVTNEEINKLAYVKGLPSVAVETDDDRFIGLYTERDDYGCTVDTFFPNDVQKALVAVELDLANGYISIDDTTSEMERRLREEDLTEQAWIEE